jgi:ABC-type antimicrobial peptide transport system permease subunit
MWMALRGLLRRPGFTILAIVSLAVGLGLITALASLADAILFRPLPVAQPGEVARIFTTSREQAAGFVSFPDFDDFRRAPSIRGAVAQTQLLIAVGDPPRIRMGLAITPDYFDVLGVAPAIGRGFRVDDAHTPVVILSYAFWRANPRPPGTTIRLGRTPFTVIGVAPENFGLDRFVREDFYVLTGAFAAGLLPSNGSPLEDRSRRFFSIFARVRGPLEAAQAEIASISARLEKQFPETNRGRRAVLMTEYQARIHSDLTMPALARILGGVAALIIAMTAANFAALLLVRVQLRARDTAVRVTLGATTARLVGENALESGLLAAAALAIGLPLGWGAARTLARLAVLPTDFHFAIDPRLDLRIAGFAMATAVMVAIAGNSAGMRAARWRNFLIVVEIALASLLSGADAMLIGKIAATRKLDLGYRTEGVFVAALDPAQAGYDPARTRVYYDQLVERLGSLHGVKAVAMAQSVPLGYTGAQRDIAIGGDRETVWMNLVSRDYFELMRMRPVAGRRFDERDSTASPAVAVVNQELAKRCGVGCRFRMNGHNVDVVGVVLTAKYFSLGEAPRPYFYVPYSQNYASRMIVHVDGGSIRDVLEAIRRMDPSQPLSEARMLAGYAAQGATFQTRVARDAIGLVGICGLILALTGLYGVISHDAARRQREIGIRMAIGASRATLVRLLIVKGWMAVVIGTAIGSIVAIACSRVLASATGGGDLNLWLAPCAGLGVLAVASIAVLVPAWRGSAIDPAQVLRRN